MASFIKRTTTCCFESADSTCFGYKIVNFERCTVKKYGRMVIIQKM